MGNEGQSHPVDGDELLNERESARFVKLTPRALESRRRRGEPPRFIRFSLRAVRYRRRDLEAFIAAHVVEPGEPTSRRVARGRHATGAPGGRS